MTKRPPPISVRLFTAFAQSQAECERVPADKRQQFVERAVRCFSTVLSQQFGGQTVRMFASRRPNHDRMAQRLRINAALRLGESVAAIAHREGISPGHVRKLRARQSVP
jgi:hypothetical protein